MSPALPSVKSRLAHLCGDFPECVGLKLQITFVSGSNTEWKEGAVLSVCSPCFLDSKLLTLQSSGRYLRAMRTRQPQKLEALLTPPSGSPFPLSPAAAPLSDQPPVSPHMCRCRNTCQLRTCHRAPALAPRPCLTLTRNTLASISAAANAPQPPG